MTPTPERALELADLLEVCQPNVLINGAPVDEIRAYLRHYADIAPRWQAVLDAEPVAWLVHAEYPYPLPDGPIEGGLPRSPLIIKPTP
jgi:hypothetical protein